MYRLITALLVFASPLLVSAASGILDSTTTISSLNLLIAQYDARIKQLEAENSVLKNEMVKANIKIPLVDYSGAIANPLPTNYPSTPITSTNVTSLAGTSSTSQTSVSPIVSPTGLPEIATKHGKDSAGFISRINQDWSAIKDFYKISPRAHLAGYEFVQSGANDHVFADIVIGTGTAGVYDMKILYQFEKSEYKRKLIGIFRYNPETGRYITLQGVNPFSGTVRNFIRDPYFIGTITLPSTAGGTTTVVSGEKPVTIITPTTPSTTTPILGSVTLADITKAYSEKKYLSTITLSNAYLEKNKPTAEILNIRYRTFFIIGKYTESLAEVAKIEAIGALDRQTACNAQVIATYSQNGALVAKYAAVCKK